MNNHTEKRGIVRSALDRAVRAILAFPKVYRTFQRLIRGNAVSVYLSTYVRPHPGDHILDIGCGPGDVLMELPPVKYLGLDCSAEYIQAARERFSDRGVFMVGRIQDASADQPGTYDLVLANGVLHHLDDGEALHLFRLAQQALKPEGRLVTIDGCYEEEQATLARLLLRMDRGKFVRRREAYIELASQVFPGIQANVRHDLFRLPYTHLIMECRSTAVDPGGLSSTGQFEAPSRERP